MKRLCLLLSACVLLDSCQTQTARIMDVSDLPIKSTSVPGRKWEMSPLRAQSLHVFHEAKIGREVKGLVGDYYYVTWYDARPDLPAKLVMRYTQARTTRTERQSVIEFTEPRQSSGSRKERFVFIGEDRAEGGDILSWRVELYVDGKLVDSRQSYLWE